MRRNLVDSGQEVKAHHQGLEYVNMGTTDLKMRTVGFGLDEYHYRELMRFVYSFIFPVSCTSTRSWNGMWNNTEGLTAWSLEI